MRPLKRLTLLRHAKAQQDSGGLADRERALTERGEQDAPLMGRRLRETGARPSLIITSPAVRALQTARLLAREIGYPLEFLQREADLYLAPPDDILAVISRQDDAFKDLLVCGHNPGLTQLAGLLTGRALEDIPPCGLVVIEAAVDSWTGLRSGTLRHYETPRPQG